MQVTDGEGKFSFDDLNPGTYTVVLSIPGFEEKRFAALTVPMAEELRAVMPIATLSESITVHATLPVPVTLPPRDHRRVEDRTGSAEQCPASD